ncbi:hypothetical protein QMZ92_22020 [Streptomyces sp. HNM0645]|uniref:hypothetical protein n=1 Tax=Streptomyces sp. HNM0645 TaxID=2782343 RepID=UPI0024B78A10|nr:hypothetical protein [Streptomyces sp. HNM0645]MDI9886971.1 hypothetical protein [Streptomyces sp. HNM0645]
MHPRTRPLTLAVLLAATGLVATGCVSVPGTPPPPPPGLAPAGAPSPASLSPERAAEQAPTHAELASTGPEESPRPRPSSGHEADDGRRAEARAPGGADAPQGRERRAAVPEKPARGRQGDKGRAEEARSPRKHTKHRDVRPPRVRTHYDMGDLCRASDGVADPSFVAMCRASYGR